MRRCRSRLASPVGGRVPTAAARSCRRASSTNQISWNALDKFGMASTPPDADTTRSGARSEASNNHRTSLARQSRCPHSLPTPACSHWVNAITSSGFAHRLTDARWRWRSPWTLTPFRVCNPAPAHFVHRSRIGLGQQLMLQQCPSSDQPTSSRKNELCCPRRLFILPFAGARPVRRLEGREMQRM